MTRERPAAGGTDTAVGGEFPGDLGKARAEPTKVSTPYKGELNESGFPRKGPSNEYTPLDVSPSPILMINDYPVGGSLSGIYQFSTPNVLSLASPSINLTGTVASGGTGTANTTISFTGTYFMGFMASPTISPTGTNTLSPSGLTWAASVSGLTAGNVFPTYTGLAMSMNNVESVTSGQSFSPAPHQNPAPAYPLEHLRGAQLVAKRAVIPKGSTTFTANLTINPTTTISLGGSNALFYGFQGFNTGAIVSTIASEL